MNPTLSIPEIDPIALPAPVWLLYGLLIATFLLHVIPMSMTLGGGFWAVLLAYRGARDLALRVAAEHLGRWLPIWTAATITTGVAVLLFLQTLYGQFFYASAVVIAWPWLILVGLVMVAYYGYYFRSMRFAKHPRAAFWIGLMAWLLFVVVAFIQTNQMTLMLRPDRMHAIYVADPTGANLNWGEPTLWPRYLHMLLGTIGLSSLWVAWIGARMVAAGDAPRGRRVVSFAIHGFLVLLGLQVVDGFWWMASLPNKGWLLFMGGSPAATIYFNLSLLLMTVGAWILWRAVSADSPTRKLVVGTAHIGAVVLLMLLMRDLLRRQTLGESIRFSQMPVDPQWGAIGLFFGLLITGLAIVIWMVRAVRRSSEIVAASEE